MYIFNEYCYHLLDSDYFIVLFFFLQTFRGLWSFRFLEKRIQPNGVRLVLFLLLVLFLVLILLLIFIFLLFFILIFFFFFVFFFLLLGL